MISKFPKEFLGKACLSIYSGGTPNTKEQSYWDGGIPWLSSGETDKRYITKTNRTISQNGIENSSTRLGLKDDIVIASAGQGKTRGQVSQLKIDTYVNQSILIVRANPDILNQRFLFFYLSNRYNDLRQMSDAHSSRGSLTTKLLEIFKIPLPSLPTQERIVDILGGLDHKIELNRHMNATLEATAKAIFKSWFVDFDPVYAKMEGRDYSLPAEVLDLFPNELVESELGLIPQGWKLVALDTICSVIDCLHSKKPAQQDMGKLFIQVFNIGDEGRMDFSKKYFIEDKDYTQWVSRIEASPGDIIISKTGRVGAIAQIPNGIRAALGRNLIGIRGKKDYVTPQFLRDYFLSNLMHNQIMNNTSQGTILESLHVKNVSKFRILLPSKSLIWKYSEIIKDVHHKMENNDKEIETLTELRDTLLPKLMSGEIEV